MSNQSIDGGGVHLFSLDGGKKKGAPLPPFMHRQSVHFSNAGWRQHQKQQKQQQKQQKQQRQQKFLSRFAGGKKENIPQKPKRKKVELVKLVPLQWVGGFWDPHWQYKLVVKVPPSKATRVYECRYSTLRCLLEEKPADPFVFPATHWLPRGKIFDSYEDAETRGMEMLEALRGYTARDILLLVDKLTLVDEEEEEAERQLSSSGASSASSGGESV